MRQLRKDEKKMGPLHIVKLPTATYPIQLSEATPNTIARMGFHRTGQSQKVMEQWEEGEGQFEFHDVNESYLEASRVNR